MSALTWFQKLLALKGGAALTKVTERYLKLKEAQETGRLRGTQT